ncbi:SDR family oxidoreductase [Paucibacter sp. PLA-PC-4]|uniref:dTDP-4-dehydrorhamnose reductase family protein n=1 Tax=Paucibacter sp. PLA-PC-4 TaxID=2993655 RepID=UPI00224A8943|nr:SDR family oxidoreductase [Paucibacter sp. PLA-PC-4]MCX2865129.1 SDR family oxidoreductase [Paucibacter sp. PLA-PC-4]
MTKPYRLLVLGANGMLGHAVLRWFARDANYSVCGVMRAAGARRQLQLAAPRAELIDGVDVGCSDQLAGVLAQVKPDVVINCVGVVKQLAAADDPLISLPINALLPHRLVKLCHLAGARLIHVSTDCVFSGAIGGYREHDPADARDLYGLSKFMGEVDAEHAITLRTSIIGHELSSRHGLVAWFLSQQGVVQGYTRAIFSGLPTVELARVIEEHVLPRPELRGTYHVSASPISKFDLLRLVAQEYGHLLVVEPNDRLVIDRSLNSERFQEATGYSPPDWTELVRRMRDFGWNTAEKG